MDKLKRIIPLALLLALALNSCKTTTHTARKSAFYPDVVKLQINMNELAVAGETEITVSYHSYLGLFTVISEVNGEEYNPYEKNTTSIEGVWFGVASQLDKAAGKIIEEHPDAAYYNVVYKKKSVESLIFGKEIKETALIRAYSFMR